LGDEVKEVFQKLESRDKERGTIGKLDNQFSRANNQCPVVLGEETLKCTASKYFKIVIQETVLKLKKTSLQIEKGPLKIAHKMKKSLLQGPTL
jgi:hypothetical protein